MVKTKIHEMAEALEANVDYLKNKKSDTLKLSNGVLQPQNLPGLFVYRFESQYASRFDLDKEFDILINDDKTHNGQLMALGEEFIEVGLAENLGSKISSAQILIGNYYLLEKLKERITEDKPRHQLGDQLLEPHNGDISISNSVELDINLTEGLNRYQHKALVTTLGNSITYIWGPPGTGKTRTIAAIIDALIEGGENVLLLSHTNIATDEALYKVAHQFRQRGNEALESGQVIRIGEIQHAQLRDEFKGSVTIEGVIAGRVQAINEEIAQCRHKISQLESELSDSEAIKRRLLSRQLLVGESDALSLAIDKLAARQMELSRELVSVDEGMTETYRTIIAIEQRSGIGRMFGSLKLKQHQNRHQELIQKQQTMTTDIKKAESNLKLKQSRLAELIWQIKKAGPDIADLDLGQIESRCQSLDSEITDQKKLIDQANKRREAASKSIIRDARLIATTLTNSHLKREVINRDYDCVVIDEASMAPLPAVWYAANLAAQRVVVVGDFCQLSPVVDYPENDPDHKAEMVDKWLRRSVFETSGIDQAVKNSSLALPSNLSVLREQHRMPPAIADLVNHLIYGRYREGQFSLITPGGAESSESEILGGQKIGVIDTSDVKPAVSKAANNSPYCLFNAALAVGLVGIAKKKGYENIGVVTAYRAQANLIQKILKDHNLEESVEANTIHKFQGGERDLIIFDVTQSYKTSFYVRDERLTNVALSRTRGECLVIGESETILSSHDPTSTPRRMLQYLKENKKPFYKSKAIIEKLGPLSAGSPSQVDVGSNSNVVMVNADQFYPRLKHDIDSASKEIIIVSPFLDVGRCREVLDWLQAARSRAVPAFVITRAKSKGSSNNGFNPEGIKLLESGGVFVLPISYNTHEKLVITDRRSFWSGSLNILSHKNSTDWMHKFENTPEAVKQLLASYRFEKNVPNMGEFKLEQCRKCNGPGSLIWAGVSKFKGVWARCLFCHKGAR